MKTADNLVCPKLLTYRCSFVLIFALDSPVIQGILSGLNVNSPPKDFILTKTNEWEHYKKEYFNFHSILFHQK